MPLTPVEFLKFAGGQISKTFSGEPLALQPFLNSVPLIKTIAGADNADLLKSFVLSKLEGAALECIPADPADINAITNALKANIKPDSSDIVAGRLQALKAQKGNLAEYAKKAEDLAEAFQRALVIEGLTLEKAKEMTVKETIKICCANARSDNVKTILQAKDFTQPKDVIAKFIVQSATDREEKQILAYKAHSRSQYNNQNNRNGYQKFGNNCAANSTRPNFRNQQPFNNGNGNGYNTRGRGGNTGRGGNRYYFNNNRNQGGNHSTNANSNNDHFMRMLTQNFQGPSGGRAVSNGPVQPLPQDERREQVFRIPI